MSPARSTTDTATGARRGAQFLERLRQSPPNIWYRGEQVRDVTSHPAMRGGVATVARLYDLQWEHAERALYTSPTTGRQVAKSFMMPRTHEELRGVTAAMKIWHDYTRGMMGRVHDYINRAITAYAAGAAFLCEDDARFGENAQRYYTHIREHDLCLTHTLIPPQANRAVNMAKQADPYLSARVK